MKKLFVFAAALLFFLPLGLAAQDVTPVIDQIKQQYAPDKRTTVFDIKAVPTNGPVVLTGETSVPEAKAALLKAVKEKGIEAMDAITLLPDQKSTQGKTYGVVRIPVGTLRYGPSYSSEQATQILLGTPVRILKKDGWYLVQTPEDYVSWVSASAIHALTKEEYNAYVAKKKLIYLSDAGWIYEKPDASSRRVSDVVAGSLLIHLGDKGKYAHVELVDGRKGYVAKADAADFTQWARNTRPAADNVVKDALRFMGVAYLWAGTSVKMMDCSGFAKTVYMLNGVILQRDASQQCFTGDPVDISGGYKNLQPGDLVFWGGRNTDGSPGRATHVGIYLGDGRYIHEAGDVHVNSFNPAHEEYSQYYVDRLIRAVRIIGNQDKGKGITSFEMNPYYQVQE